MIIGLTGSLCAGKGTVAEFLKGKGLERSVSLSDIMDQELQILGIQASESLFQKSRRVKPRHLAMIEADLAVSELRDEHGYHIGIISGLTNVHQVTELKKLTSFYLIGVTSPPEVRFFRAQKAQKIGPDASLDNFREIDAVYSGQIGGSLRNISDCLPLSDVLIENHGTLEDLHGKCEKAYDYLRKKSISDMRPGWDDYFLKVALLVAERATCFRHAIGAVIVKDKRILTTGYNGAPSGVEDCLEKGFCVKDKLGLPSALAQERCQAVHAEQNALIQASSHGVGVAGATMYCTHTPCYVCAKSIVNAKIKKVVTFSEYPDGEFGPLFKEAGVEFVKHTKPSERIQYRP